MIRWFVLLTVLVLAIPALNAKTTQAEPVYIGVHLEPIDNTTPGMVVTKIAKDSPADKAGLKPGMKLIKLDGKTIKAGGEAMASLRAVLDDLFPGIPVEIVARTPGGEEVTLKLSPVSRKKWMQFETKKLADRIVDRVSKMRGLKVKKEVTINLYTRDGLGNHMRQEFERDLIADDMKKGDLLMTRLGVLPKGVNTLELTLKMFKMGVQGFYTPDDKELVLISGQSGAQSEAVMAHELVHMLQDQHFGLKDMMVTTLYNSDRRACARFIAEGDAKNLELEYMMKVQGIDQRNQWLSPRKPGGQYVPPAIDPENRFFMIMQKEMMGPYTLGARFVAEAKRRGGWDGVNRLYHDLPVSTEQCLHWEKYFDKRDDPQEIDLHDFIDWADDDKYEVTMYDVMGELSTTRLFLNFCNRKIVNAEQVGEGWDGDRIIGLMNKKTKKPVIVWLSVWDSEKDAEEFEKGVAKLYQRRFGAHEGGDPKIIAKDKDGNVTRLVREGAMVSLVDGAPETEANDIAKRAEATAEIREYSRKKFMLNRDIPEDMIKKAPPAEIEDPVDPSTAPRPK